MGFGAAGTPLLLELVLGRYCRACANECRKAVIINHQNKQINDGPVTLWLQVSAQPGKGNSAPANFAATAALEQKK